MCRTSEENYERRARREPAPRESEKIDARAATTSCHCRHMSCAQVDSETIAAINKLREADGDGLTHNSTRLVPAPKAITFTLKISLCSFKSIGGRSGGAIEQQDIFFIVIFKSDFWPSTSFFASTRKL
jgi:hypothetical protein